MNHHAACMERPQHEAYAAVPSGNKTVVAGNSPLTPLAYVPASGSGPGSYLLVMHLYPVAYRHQQVASQALHSRHRPRVLTLQLLQQPAQHCMHMWRASQ
jgi:hypothetical protein